MACNTIGDKLICDSWDEASHFDRLANGDYGDSALDILASVPQFFNALGKYVTHTDGYFGENRSWKENFFSADATVLNNPITRLWVGFPVHMAAGTANTISIGHFKESLDWIGIENHLSPPPSTKYETYNYVNGCLLLIASALAGFVKFSPKVAVSDRAPLGIPTVALATAEKPAPLAASPKYVMGEAGRPVSLTGNPGRIIKVAASPNYSEGILVRGWKALEDALRDYAQAKHSADTSTELVRASVASEGLPAARFIATHISELTAGKGGGFLDRMLSVAYGAVERRGVWSNSFEYEALGTPFFKTDIAISHVGTDLFTLKIRAAYVGSKSEIALAETIGAPRVLKDARVEVVLEPVAETPTFVVNVGEILSQLDQALGRQKIIADKVARALTKESRLGERASVEVYKDADHVVELKLGNVESPLRGNNPFSVDGCLVSGTCRTVYYPDRPHSSAPTITITVKFAKKGAEYNPANYPAMLELAEKVRQAMAGEKALPSPEGQ